MLLCAEFSDAVKLFGDIKLCRYICEMSKGFVIY